MNDEIEPFKAKNPNDSAAGRSRHVFFDGMGFPILAFAVSLHYWNSVVLYPFKILTVLFHELSHGIVVILTGGTIERILIDSQEGGACVFRGGNELLISAAGYLGSLLWGAVLLTAAVRSNRDRMMVKLLGVIMITTALIYVRSFFGFVFCIVFGTTLLYMSSKAGEFICDQFLRYIGLTSMFYVLIDIKSDLIDRTVRSSDAYRFGEILGVPPLLVGSLWFIAALFVAWYVVKSSISIQSKQ